MPRVVRFLIDQRAVRHGRNIVRGDERDFPLLRGGIYLAIVFDRELAPGFGEVFCVSHP